MVGRKKQLFTIHASRLFVLYFGYGCCAFYHQHLLLKLCENTPPMATLRINRCKQILESILYVELFFLRNYEETFESKNILVAQNKKTSVGFTPGVNVLQLLSSYVTKLTLLQLKQVKGQRYHSKVYAFCFIIFKSRFYYMHTRFNLLKKLQLFYLCNSKFPFSRMFYFFTNRRLT